MFKFKKEIKVLIVDDDFYSLGVLKEVLRNKGCKVLDFANPSSALEELKKEKVDLVLSDLKMPEMDGIHFMNLVKKMHPSVPVIMITGFASIDTAVSAIKWGAFDYLKKPYEIPKIYDVIERALQSIESN